ncbi:MAG: EAL domain-containing protein [Clostridium tyrobutyricum]|jgi:EAL and modified HD-GYP domain-containing signal transduction protein|uniref:EAL and HDOD domain-containing protein n=1 Tax=Clostridium tyrobutyricum TaxID=1519 RepID=UPI0024313BAE|nr:EAL domain-containing protein [Clostridium tyrobutyricum]MCH4198506.1 EAL domain-containing protein [Clostridium tyrobutyricum]MCH4237434.1 EAL domain-containing protein [Clostridium tyrobutyricum]MCH4259025.1 EAL domain-containing protein [Clostridium tyrobutyricum]MCI1239877.1 EAL domain-containing protein [Clostridium tyrobutyricum]MCI1652954.1 EAL domain-containing protein [Clostridium tyrobutyricum]
MNVYVAKQAIVDRFNNTIGYELLFRDTYAQNRYTAMDGDKATLQLLQNSIVNIGMNKLVGTKKAFVNFTDNILKSNICSFISPQNIIIEILEDIQPTDRIIESCKLLKQKGFILALDDFVFKNKYMDLIKLADIIKIDFFITKNIERENVLKKIHDINGNIKFLAEKVETSKDFKEALSLGYSYFQGYFFSKPQIVTGEKDKDSPVLFKEKEYNFV